MSTVTKLEAEQVKFTPAGTGAVATTVQTKLRESVSVKDFGAVGDGESHPLSERFADLAAAQAVYPHAVSLTDQIDWAAWQSAVKSGAQTIYFTGRNVLNRTVFVPIGVHIIGDGRNAVVMPVLDGTYTLNFMFVFNSTNGVNWTTAFPGYISGGMTNVYFNNSNGLSEIKGCLAFGSYEFHHIRSYKFTQTIKRPDKATNEYCDFFKVSRSIFYDQIGSTDYQIELSGVGDQWLVDQCIFPNHDEVTLLAQRAVLVNGSSSASSSSHGGRINDCICGDYKFKYTQKATVSGGHYEQSQFIVECSNVDFTDSILFEGDFVGNPYRIPILCIDTVQSNTYRVTLTNVQFLWGYGKWINNGFDLCLPATFRASLRNTCRNIEVFGNSPKMTAIRVCSDSAGTKPNYNFEDCGYAFAGNGELIGDGQLMGQAVFNTAPGSYLGVQNATLLTEPMVPWTESLGTYYYKAQLFFDRVRKLGKNSAYSEISVTVDDTSKIVRLKVQQNGWTVPAILRIYRGTSAGVYSHYADVKVLGLAINEYLFDVGASISGEYWKVWNGPLGAVDPLHTIYGKVVVNGSLAECNLNVAPTVGSWGAGDRIVRNPPVVGQPKAWVATVSGTFGTLYGITGGISVNTTSLVVNSTVGLFVGCYITIAGVTGVKKVVDIAGLTVTIDAISSATVSAAEIAFSTPVFVSEGNL